MAEKKNKLKKSEWIRKALENHDYNIEKVHQMFDEYNNEYPDASEQSFKVLVSNISRKKGKGIHEQKKEAAKHTEDYRNTTDDELFELVHKWTKEAKKKLGIKELRDNCEKENIDYMNYYRISNGKLHRFLSSVYREIFESSRSHQIEVKDLKDQISNWKKKVKEMQSTEMYKERIISNLLNALEEYDGIDETEAIEFIGDDTDDEDKPKREALLHISDVHYSEVVTEEEVRNLNKYDEAIAEKRLEHTFNSAVETMKELNVTDLTIFLGGDMLSGNIHEELTETNQSEIGISVIRLYDIICSYISRLAKYYNIRVYAIAGNHSRMTKKPKYKKAAVNNFEYIMYEFTKRRLENIVTEFYVPNRSFDIIDILGYKFYLCHGENVGKNSSGFSPIPNTASRDFAMVSSLHRNKKLENPIDVDYFVIGHFHVPAQSLTFEGRPILYNGSLIGANEYSINKVKKGSEACQKIYIIQENEGVRYPRKIFSGHIR